MHWREAYIQLPDREPARSLYAGQITPDPRPGYFRGEFTLRRRQIAAGAQLLLYHDGSGRFTQQLVLVEAVALRGATTELSLACVSEPLSAECRQWQRVPAAGCGAAVRLSGDRSAELLDVGVAGVSVCTDATFEVGDTVEVMIALHSCAATFLAQVRSAVALAEGDWHYGLLSVDAAGQPRAGGLAEIYLELLRRQRAEAPTVP